MIISTKANGEKTWSCWSRSESSYISWVNGDWSHAACRLLEQLFVRQVLLNHSDDELKQLPQVVRFPRGRVDDFVLPSQRFSDFSIPHRDLVKREGGNPANLTRFRRWVENTSG
jgi:hypothetical protein